MRMVDLIIDKREGKTHTREEINYIIREYTAGNIPDYQMSAWLMAVCWQGMTEREVSELTSAMMHSGDVVDLSDLPGIKVDKHSTGGVGDTTTLVLVPLCAACGAKIAKMSGRGLGHTGGTVDKMESIGMRTSLPEADFLRQVREIGCAVVGQSAELAPADKTLYALRDTTATVDSLPLIASSIMSKKLASGAQGIVLDVKVGSGAIMPDYAGSLALAKTMVDIGTRAGRNVSALLTGMDEPLGSHVGNMLEVKDAVEILRGESAGPLLTVSLALGAQLLTVGGVAANPEEGEAMLRRALADGSGLEKLRQLIRAQGGDESVCDHPEALADAPIVRDVAAPRAGVIARMDTTLLGYAAQELGAGRRQKTDQIDPRVGFIMRCRVGDNLSAGAPICTVYAANEDTFAGAQQMILRAVEIGDAPTPPSRLIYAMVTPQGVTEY